MPRLSSVLPIILLTMLGLMVMAGARITTSLYALSQHASAFKVGTLIATFALFPMLLAVFAGRWLDRVGITRPLRLGAVGMLGGLGLVLWSGHFLVLYLAAALVGSGFMLVQMVAQNMIGHFGAPEHRTTHFTWLALGASVASMCAPVTAGFVIDHFSHKMAYGLFAGFALVLVWVTYLPLYRQAAPPAQVSKRQSGSMTDLLWRDPHLRLLYLVSILLASSWDLFMFVTPIQGNLRGFSASTIGLIIGSFSSATFVVRFVMPLINRFWRGWRVIVPVLLIISICFALFPWMAQAWSMMLLAFVLGLGLGASQPNMLNLLYQLAPDGRAGEALGIRITIGNAAQVGIPLTFGAAGASMGLQPVFWAMSVLVACGLLLVWHQGSVDHE